VTLGSTHASLGISPTKDSKQQQLELDQKTNRRAFAKSLFKDDEIRTLLMSKFHQKQCEYINASIAANELAPFKGRLFIS